MKICTLFLSLFALTVSGMEVCDIQDVTDVENPSIFEQTKSSNKKKRRKRKKKKTADPVCVENVSKKLYQRLLVGLGKPEASTCHQASSYFQKLPKIDFDPDKEMRYKIKNDLLGIAFVAYRAPANTSNGSPLNNDDLLALYAFGRCCMEADNKYAQRCREKGWLYPLPEGNMCCLVYPQDFVRWAAQVGHRPSRMYLAMSKQIGLSESMHVKYASMLWSDETLSKQDKELVWNVVDTYEKRGYLLCVMMKLAQSIHGNKVENYFKTLEQNFPPIMSSNIDGGIHNCGDRVYEELDRYKKRYWSAQALSAYLQVITNLHNCLENNSAIWNMLDQITQLDDLKKQHPELTSMLASCYAFLGHAYETQSNLVDAEESHNEAMKHGPEVEDVLFMYTKFLIMHKPVDFLKKSAIKEHMKMFIDTAVNRKVDAFLLSAKLQSLLKDKDQASYFLQKAQQQMQIEQCLDEGRAQFHEEIAGEIAVQSAKKSVRAMREMPISTEKYKDIVFGEMGTVLENALSNPVGAAEKLFDIAKRQALFSILHTYPEGFGLYDQAIAAIQEAQKQQPETVSWQIDLYLDSLNRLKNLQVS